MQPITETDSFVCSHAVECRLLWETICMHAVNHRLFDSCRAAECQSLRTAGVLEGRVVCCVPINVEKS